MDEPRDFLKRCPHPWTTLQVLSNGEARMCCWANFAIGSVKTSSIEEIWNCQVAKDVRACVANGKVHPMCKGAACKFIQDMKGYGDRV